MTACEECGGACCKSLKMPWPKTEDEGFYLSLHGVRAYKDGIRLACSCVALEEGRCVIYDQRPVLCREFEVGSKGCLEAIGEFCPEKMETIKSLMKE